MRHRGRHRTTVIRKEHAGQHDLRNESLHHRSDSADDPQRHPRNLHRPTRPVDLHRHPGYHLSEQKLNLKLQETAKASLEETDIVLYVIDPTRKGGEEELAIAHLLGAIKTPVVAVLNKSDIASGMEMLEAESFLTTNLPQAKRLHASAKEDNGVDEILIALFDLAKEGELLYPETNGPTRAWNSGSPRSSGRKAIATVTQEIPHAIYVELADLENQESDQTHLDPAFIVVETDSQKGNRHRRRRPEHP
jgi:GTP-binding protein Era